MVEEQQKINSKGYMDMNTREDETGTIYSSKRYWLHILP